MSAQTPDKSAIAEGLPAAADRPFKVESGRQFSYIDALRGYAVLLVILSHVGGVFSQLPWPIRAVSNFGFHGVQLFFILSCVTLLKSWHSRLSRETALLSGFFIRRAFRILPMYVLAAILYYYISPPGKLFSWQVLLTSLTFTNGWEPHLLGMDGGWVVVPGGWSITTEFSFYLLFPFFAMRLTTLPRAVAAFLVSLLLAATFNSLAEKLYLDEYGPQATGQFIYYWLPNQLSVFALGFINFRVDGILNRESVVSATLKRSALPIIICLAGAAVWLSFRHLPREVTLDPPFLPVHVYASFLFMALFCVLSVSQPAILVNRASVWLGRVSFSAYLLHFSIISAFLAVLPGGFTTDTSGMGAILRFSALLAGVGGTTFLLSLGSYRWVERPMIELGGRLANRLSAEAQVRRLERLADPEMIAKSACRSK